MAKKPILIAPVRRGYFKTSTFSDRHPKEAHSSGYRPWYEEDVEQLSHGRVVGARNRIQIKENDRVSTRETICMDTYGPEKPRRPGIELRETICMHTYGPERPRRPGIKLRETARAISAAPIYPAPQQIGTTRLPRNEPLGVVGALEDPSRTAEGQDDTNQVLSEQDHVFGGTFHLTELPTDGNQHLDDQHRLAAANLSLPQDCESPTRQTPSDSANTYRIKTCHAMIGTSTVGVGTSLSVALWWSFARSDPGSGFTIGSYVLAVFGVMWQS